jgi:hypothetical protein
MKKQLLFLVCLLAFVKTEAQVVFCPPGAQWNYLFSGTIFWPGNTYNETINYVGDSISGADTLKILVHNRFFMACGIRINKTFIKQKGDTVFFNNYLTQGSWQILYNFAAQPGQGWQTTVLKSYTTTITFSVTVQSVSTVTLNGFSLKQLIVSGVHWGSIGQITERIGSGYFLFNFSSKNPGSCDGDVFLEPLCYTDNAFGTKQFGEKSCDYYTRNSVSITNQKFTDRKFKVYPNPVNDFLHIEIKDFEKVEIRLTDIYGRTISHLTKEAIDLKIQLNTAELKNGIYFLQVFSKETLISTKKVIKE